MWRSCGHFTYNQFESTTVIHAQSTFRSEAGVETQEPRISDETGQHPLSLPPPLDTHMSICLFAHRRMEEVLPIDVEQVIKV